MAPNQPKLSTEQYFDALWAYVTKGVPAPDGMEVEDLLKMLRQELGLLASEFARIAEVQASTVSRWEKGEGLQSTRKLHKALSKIRPMVKDGPEMQEGSGRFVELMESSKAVMLSRRTGGFLVDSIEKVAEGLMSQVSKRRTDPEPLKVYYLFPDSSATAKLPNEEWRKPGNSLVDFRRTVELDGLSDFFKFLGLPTLLDEAPDHEIVISSETDNAQGNEENLASKKTIKVSAEDCRQARLNVLSLTSPLAGWVCFWFKGSREGSDFRDFDVYLEMRAEDSEAVNPGMGFSIVYGEEKYHYIKLHHKLRNHWHEILRIDLAKTGFDEWHTAFEELVRIKQETS